MRAEPAAQVRMLDLQQIDTELARCAHRLRTIPEADQVRDHEQRLQHLRDEQATTRAAMSDLKQQIERTEADITAVRSRTQRDKELLESGAVAASKHLTELEHEIDTLARRQMELEDAELELMQSMEDLEKVDAAVTEQLGKTEAQLHTAKLAVSEQTDAIAVERQDLQRQREQVASELPTDLVGLYERIRADGAPVAAGWLRGERCEACQMELAKADSAELRAAPVDEVLRCPECRSIVVRAELMSA